MPVAVGIYRQSQPRCFNRMKMGFMMGCAVGMAACMLFSTFSCLRIEIKNMMQSGGTISISWPLGWTSNTNQGHGFLLYLPFPTSPRPCTIIKQV
ncbi:unnamed protein product [Nyctereutes procyonoides]|uniref:Reactive oxygen species modulator 1 n=1 Tax=Nyctereutes procyonoides TaxID=34880 RepID=A0A811Z2Q2_NYCPR|nr:unnamed protein product [Nyctereutes procyonoides]